MSTVSDKFQAYADGKLTFDALMDWADDFDWADAPLDDSVPGTERTNPWPGPNSAEEIRAAEIDGLITAEEADALFAVVGEPPEPD